MLVAPLMQYPTSKSQIYEQAIKRNVTLLSYTHLHFLLIFIKERVCRNFGKQEIGLLFWTNPNTENFKFTGMKLIKLFVKLSDKAMRN